MQILSYVRTTLAVVGYLGMLMVLSIMIPLIGNLPNPEPLLPSEAFRFTLGFGLIGIAIWAILILPSKNPMNVDVLGKFIGWLELISGLMLVIGSLFILPK